MKESKLYVVNGLAMFVSFLLLRGIYLLWVCYFVVRISDVNKSNLLLTREGCAARESGADAGMAHSALCQLSAHHYFGVHTQCHLATQDDCGSDQSVIAKRGQQGKEGTVVAPKGTFSMFQLRLNRLKMI